MRDGWRKRVVEAIEKDGRSQRKLAEAASVSSSFINELITLDKEPSADKLLRVIHALKLSVTYVFTGVELSAEVEEFAQLLDKVPEAEREPLLKMLRSRTSTGHS